MTIGKTYIALLYVHVMVFTGCTKLRDEKVDEPNRLATSSSPYLREHSDNPVDWYEWGEEALAKAKSENKPLIISIGYASCHWCHVMERESFMDTAVARLMNENFVSIKIDREERPDIDQIYLDAAQLISGNSGWPLNAFALPNGKPFYAGTYFPKEQWIAILRQVAETYKNENTSVLEQAEALTKAIQGSRVTDGKTETAFNQKLYQNIFANWEESFDFEYGGLKGSPKFPLPAVGEFLLQNYYLTDNKNALKAVTTTLDKMANGGIYDHLGGGFARYSTDQYWKVPHFEKMLYDNAQLVSLYAHAFQVTGSKEYAMVIKETLDFVRRDLLSPDGGFYSSINADSEDEEGRYYVWTKAEIESVMDPVVAKLFIEFYQVTDSGNWEKGKNVLYPLSSKHAFAARKNIPAETIYTTLESAERELLRARGKRVAPSTDDKILTSWNALMLKGFLDAYFALGDSKYLQNALANARFLEKNMIRQDGRLWRNFKDGKAATDAFLDDYALLAKAFIQLYQATLDIHWLGKARVVTDYAVEHFRDEKRGIFYYTSADSENLVVRTVEMADNVIPSSNSVFAEVLYLLGEYYAEDLYIQMSSAMLRYVTNELTGDQPFYANWANLLGRVTYQPYEVAVVGDDALAKLKELQVHYLPTTIFMGGSEEDLPLLKNKQVDQRTIIYVCRNKTCKMPEEDVGRAMQQLTIRAVHL